MPKDEADELAELHSLFGHATDVPRGMLLRFQVSKENREKADRERQAKEDRQKLLEERQEEQRQRIERLRAKRGELDREAVAKHQANNRRQASRVKAEVQEWEAIRRQKQQQKVKKVQDRGSADFHNARVGALEEQMLKERRDKAQQEHAAFLEREKARNQAKRQALNQQAGRLREQVEHAKTATAEKLDRLKSSQAEAARQAKQQWKEQLERNEKERLGKAQANRRHAEEVRARARANMDAQKNRRLDEGTAMEKRNQAAINATRSADLQRKRQMRQQQYGRRFASSAEAAAMQKSTFRRLYGLNGIISDDKAQGAGPEMYDPEPPPVTPPQAEPTPPQSEPPPKSSTMWGWG